MKRRIGIHLRVFGSLIDVLKKAERLGLSCFQFFFIEQRTGRSLRLKVEEIELFKQVCKEYQGTIYLHASYWINLADGTRKDHPILRKEIKLAKRLGIKHIVLHPGTAKGVGAREEAIKVVARVLNLLTKKEPEMTFILENVGHAGMSIGGDIRDFKKLRALLNEPDKIKFCLDTAHAYVYGYDITKTQDRKNFFNLLQDCIGLSNIALIHLNDTKEICGSHIDEHAILGQGMLGNEVLQEIVCHPQLEHVPIIMELPVIPDNEEIAVVQWLKKWKCKNRE